MKHPACPSCSATHRRVEAALTDHADSGSVALKLPRAVVAALVELSDIHAPDLQDALLSALVEAHKAEERRINGAAQAVATRAARHYNKPKYGTLAGEKERW